MSYATPKSKLRNFYRGAMKNEKADAVEKARTVKAKALDEARTLLEAAGLTLRALEKKGDKKAGRAPSYVAGRTYQHPADKSLVWNAKGQQPNWLRELEGQGARPVEAPGSPANGNQTHAKKIG
jgi:DNA-binding protein H-NS